MSLVIPHANVVEDSHRATLAPHDRPFAGEGSNRLLAALSPADFALVAPHLESVTLELRQPIAEPGQAFSHAYFPEGALISAVSEMRDGSSIEVGAIGDEGFAGLPAYLFAESAAVRTFTQISGNCRRLPVQILLSAAEESVTFRRLFNRYAHAYLSQVSQIAACNRFHNIEQRCARWILMTYDRARNPEVIPLKHEFLAMMLGVRRAGVTVAAGVLQDAGLIRYRRGGIRVLDRDGLERASCECYSVIRTEFERLLSEQ